MTRLRHSLGIDTRTLRENNMSQNLKDLNTRLTQIHTTLKYIFILLLLIVLMGVHFMLAYGMWLL